MDEKEDIVRARCEEPSEARFRVADACVISFIFIPESQGSEGTSEV